MTRSSLVASSTGQVTWLGATEYARLLVRTQCGDRFANNLADACDICLAAMRLAHPDNNEVRARHYDYVLAKVAARHKSIARRAGGTQNITAGAHSASGNFFPLLSPLYRSLDQRCPSGRLQSDSRQSSESDDPMP